MMAKSRQYFRLLTGSKMPALGLGTFQISGELAKETVDCALSIGYRHIDTARSYGNEESLGTVLQDNIKCGKVKRDDLFLTTKVPSSLIGSERDVMLSAEESLESLNTKYVDMLLIHMPFGYIPGPDPDSSSRIHVQYDLVSAWKAMEKVVKAGHAKAIGLSNFNRQQIGRIWDGAKIKPANVQMECHAYLQQREMREYCDSHGMVVTAYAPLGAPARRPVDMMTEDKKLLDDPVVKKIAKSLGCTEGWVLLRFLLQLGVAPIPKSTSPKRLEENFKAWSGDLLLDNETMQALESLNEDRRYFRFQWAWKHPEYSANEPF